jgi:hypothetical protein
VQPAVAGGTQERRRCSEEILKTVKRKRKRKLQTDSRLADWRIWCWKRWSMVIVSPYLVIFKNTYQSLSLRYQHVPMFFIVSDWRESFHVNTYQATSFWGTYKPPSLFSLSIAKLKAKAQSSIFFVVLVYSMTTNASYTYLDSTNNDISPSFFHIDRKSILWDHDVAYTLGCPPVSWDFAI